MEGLGRALRDAARLGLSAAVLVSTLAAQGTARGGESVPSAQRPPVGMCRIWIDAVPAEHQPAPTDCATAIRRRPSNARVIFGSAQGGEDRLVVPRSDVPLERDRRLPVSGSTTPQSVTPVGPVTGPSSTVAPPPPPPPPTRNMAPREQPRSVRPAGVVPKGARPVEPRHSKPPHR